jgi:hypothetical protein
MSDVDQELLLYVAAHEVLVAEQAAAFLQTTEQDANQRLEELQAERLVSCVTLSSRLPPAYRITREGAQQVDSHLPPLRALGMARYRHEIGIAWLWATARRGGFGDMRAVLSRREMQAADAASRSGALLGTRGATFGDIPAGGATVDARRAYPDLALLQPTGGWASMDVILTLPEPKWTNSMVTRLHRHPQIVAELYLVEQRAGIDQAIKAAAVQHGIADQVHVQFLAEDGIASASTTTLGTRQA